MRIVYTITADCDPPPSPDRAELLDEALAADLEDAVAAFLSDAGAGFSITSNVRIDP